jgi:hypothetical protein
LLFFLVVDNWVFNSVSEFYLWGYVSEEQIFNHVPYRMLFFSKLGQQLHTPHKGRGTPNKLPDIAIRIIFLDAISGVSFFCSTWLCIPPPFFVLYYISISRHHYVFNLFYFMADICQNGFTTLSPMQLQEPPAVGFLLKIDFCPLIVSYGWTRWT